MARAPRPAPCSPKIHNGKQAERERGETREVRELSGSLCALRPPILWIHAEELYHGRAQALRALAVLRAVVAEFNSTDGTILAAAIAYYTLLSIFPLILGLLAVFGFVLGDPSRAAGLVSVIAAIFPGAQGLI